MLRLIQIPMRQDNYSYALIKNNLVLMIDPSETKASLKFFDENPELSLQAILCTHSHLDHVEGNEALWQRWRCPVYAPMLEKDRVPKCSHPLKDGDEFELLGTKIKAHDVRAHTSGHMAYFVEEKIGQLIKNSHKGMRFEAQAFMGHQVLFVGDSLFAAGCGRLFEGTPHDLVQSLEFYRAQDGQTIMACAHEYTGANLNFAREMFGDNAHIAKRQKDLPALLNTEGTSVPCLFAEEFLTNPFLMALRGSEREMMANRFGVNIEDLPAIISALRKAKDNF